MIAKMSSSNTLYGALAYNQNKVDETHAKVIFTNKMIETADGNYDMNTCLRSFEPYLLANQKTEKPVLHVSINPDPKGVLTRNFQSAFVCNICVICVPNDCQMG
jgi:hypothetical protein